MNLDQHSLKEIGFEYFYDITALPLLNEFAVTRNNNDPRPLSSVDISLVWARYQSQKFNPLFFQRFAIFRPEDIARSIHKRQAEFFFGRLAAGLALQGIGENETYVGRGSRREPLWPKGINGSISHTDTHVAAIAATFGEQHSVGIDIENITPDSAQEAIVSKTLTLKELEKLHLWRKHLDFGLLLSLIFSAKESFFKASFRIVGHSFGFDCVSVIE